MGREAWGMRRRGWRVRGEGREVKGEALAVAGCASKRGRGVSEGSATSRRTSSCSRGASFAATGSVLHSVNSPPPGRGETSAGLGSERVKSGSARLMKPLRNDSMPCLPCTRQAEGCAGGGVAYGHAGEGYSRGWGWVVGGADGCGGFFTKNCRFGQSGIHIYSCTRLRHSIYCRQDTTKARG